MALPGSGKEAIIKRKRPSKGRMSYNCRSMFENRFPAAVRHGLRETDRIGFHVPQMQGGGSQWQMAAVTFQTRSGEKERIMSALSSSSIEEILRTARENGASDVHVAAGLPPKMRVNGILVTMNHSRITASDTLDILLRVMPDIQREGFEERGEADFSFAVAGCGRGRANAYKQKGSVAFAFHLVDGKVPAPEELGMPESVRRLQEKESGLVLVTGASGSGRSATLASMIDQINENRDALIITLEDPIEYMHPHKRSMVNQREIGLDSRSYADALRAVLREDPDVILVGELRDPESVSAALTAAETGHLVLSSLHASSVVNALNGIFDLFPPDRQEGIRGRVAEALEAVVSQRLLPSGDGRSAAFEVLLTNPDVRRIIREGGLKRLAEVMRDGAEQGMLTVEESVRRLYSAGKIDRDTAARYLGEQACRE